MSGRHAAGRLPRPPLRRFPQATVPRPIGYRCEAVATPLDNPRREIILGTYHARSPRLAARWLRREARCLARRLDPDPRAPWLYAAPLVPIGNPRSADFLRAWASDAHRYANAIAKLAARVPYQLTVTDHDARYALIVAPAPIRRPAQFPPCAGHFPSPTGGGCEPAAAYAAL
ncbi:hypothetical protein [Streptomyces sp. F001]|uniref:hypothetical protein n=1 Tax=Streptomyces sp. F001 TaxID=1510026 RepID=UPI0019CFF43E|nr:hypothetical protein [Streptomyces sp. F001]